MARYTMKVGQPVFIVERNMKKITEAEYKAKTTSEYDWIVIEKSLKERHVTYGKNVFLTREKAVRKIQEYEREKWLREDMQLEEQEKMISINFEAKDDDQRKHICGSCKTPIDIFGKCRCS